ncbi:phosphoglycerate dehydrogenase-like enzyme [Streptomyces sp. 840.1]|uniref:hydroxyacid dehydrogenase n=1 Tax=Streptomyces sp. 840.1 TaxID=2485152 RepID=UPI000F493B2D|nr:hydroxyacid dehydrogenase [Streptomyces sp. 840.1]ROQ59765.1 phosphoglycerate dehydrogenase-like enzyme [Streptomyces sp. 840.1]
MNDHLGAGQGHRPQGPPIRIHLSVAPAERRAFFPAPTLGALAALGEITESEPLALHTPDEFGRALDGVQVLVTAWGFPRLDATRLALAPDLRFVMHAASSIHWLVGDDFWATGLPVSQAGAAMGPAVAELSLTLTLSLLRRTHRLDHALRSGQDWDTARETGRGREISGARVGVVGASRTGRHYIRMCRALGADVRVHDPYIPPGDPLTELRTGLAELLATSDVIAVHAPATPETHGMIGAGEIAAMRDGALLVNTARPSVVDMDALYAEVASGRIDAALDVFASEPLPVDDRWRGLPNALLTPHIAGATADSRRRAGRIVVEEIRRHLTGQPLEHALTRGDLARMG